MTVRMVQGLLLLLLLACKPIAEFLPAQWGWENGVLENLQMLLLAGGFVSSLVVCKRHWKSPEALLALCVLPIWAVLFARELSWGAVFLPPLEMTDAGPIFSSRMLWYKPVIYPVVGVLLAVAVGIAVRYRLDRVVRRALTDGNFPLPEIALFLGAAYLSGCAEGHLRCPFDALPSRKEVLEELVEIVAYAALCLAQLRVFRSAAFRTSSLP